MIWCGNPWNHGWWDLPFETVGCGELLSIYHPDVLRADCLALVEAGADVVSAATSGGVPSTMTECGHAGMACEANRRSVQLARECGAKVLGEISPTRNLVTMHGGDPRKLRNDYVTQVTGLLDGGVNFLHVEGLMDLANARIAMEVIGDSAPPVVMSGAVEGTMTLLDGTRATAFVDFARGYNPAFIGLTGHTEAVAHATGEVFDSGRSVDFVLVQTIWPGAEHRWLQTPESLAAYFKTLLEKYPIPHIGISYGVRPDFIRALRRIA
ncbi:MAG: hypothetical protein FJW32_16005 [Acidobacteria bacterium]|nr:hypothetical protein [Acidobacteriota bacterium]